ncbi:enoyl-CoA hydratase/isomerase family protein [Cumulibacter soli]|uniref:enoyl-CoA hydratase/isomerase family protein n=1 Tax=Cumulibacter soli TaxID=2546344 RepID=UPI0010680E0F|nr:enoyl-CoA hydratase-related protein [Cumulibacter soli]
MGNGLVEIQRVNAIANVILDSPATRNALSDDLLDDLIDALQTVGDDDSVRVIVLRSSHERVFSAGGDLKGFASSQSLMNKHRGLDRFPRLYRLIGAIGKPVVCAANGDTLAGAFGLALACDLIVAKDGARFGCPEINVGVFPFMISALIYRNLPRMLANELMMVGDLIDAHQARELGIVNKVAAADEFDAQVDELAGRLADKSPLLMQFGKKAIDKTRDIPLDRALDVMRDQLALVFSTDDLREGVAAFTEKREPRWVGR